MFFFSNKSGVKSEWCERNTKRQYFPKPFSTQCFIEFSSKRWSFCSRSSRFVAKIAERELDRFLFRSLSYALTLYIFSNIDQHSKSHSLFQFAPRIDNNIAFSAAAAAAVYQRRTEHPAKFILLWNLTRDHQIFYRWWRHAITAAVKLWEHPWTLNGCKSIWCEW